MGVLEIIGVYPGDILIGVLEICVLEIFDVCRGDIIEFLTYMMNLLDIYVESTCHV